MTTNKRRVAAIAGLLAATAGAIAIYISNRPQTRPERSDIAGGAGAAPPRALGQVVVVVSSLDNYQNLLNLNPSLVLVGTKATTLRQAVKDSDKHRVIETQTEAGWQHIVKHLRPDTVVLSQGLGSESIKGFTKQVLLMEDAVALLGI